MERAGVEGAVESPSELQSATAFSSPARRRSLKRESSSISTLTLKPR